MEEVMSYFKYKISKQEIGLDLKSWMQSFYLAKNKINYLIDNKCIMVNGEIINQRNQVLNLNDEIIIDVSNYENVDYPPSRFNLKILYEDDYLLVVSKPEKTIIYPENKVQAKTMANYIANYYIKTNQNHTIRHVHRLDFDTTGCLVYAKDIFTHSYLSNAFEKNETKKEYNAIVYGIIDTAEKINLPISRNRHNNLMMVTKNGSDALTIYKPHKTFDNKTLVDVEIKTGRTHQIRVHMSYLKHPLLGDEMYGSKDEYKRVMLHCCHIGFIHPIYKYWIDFYDELPQDMKKIIGE
jgi:23S rRNA pseudouridine1911/1915/1917 synthase